MNINYCALNYIVGALVCIAYAVDAFNGNLAELECPDECDCHYFRVNWVTDCSESNLTEIPYAELSPNVYILDLNGNHIANVDPFPPDIKMRRLQLADNLMTEVRRESFAGLTYLIDADFANNKIEKIDPFTFEDSAGFISLELQDNPLNPVEGPFLYSSTLFYLDISNCGLERINPYFFSNITALSTLDLSNNPLNIIDNQEFAALTSLGILKLNNCNLTHVHKNALQEQHNLKSLELAGNLLTNVQWSHVLAPLNRLEYLDLRHSRLTELHEDTFNNSTYLRTLILAQNELIDLDVASTLGQKLTQLDVLDLSYCNLGKPLSEDAFVNANKIRALDLSGNALFSFDLLVALAPLVKLQKLSLSHCGLSVLPDTLYKFNSLLELDISHNPLNNVFVKLLAPLETLEYLNMGYSNLSYISPTTFAKMTSMKRLVLSGNDLNSLEAGLFANLTHLESLELNSCGLRKPLNATVFFNNFTYTDLTELQLAGNPLTVSSAGPLLPKQLSRIEKLDLSNCNLTFLPADAFYFTHNITHLVLKGNQFSTPNNFQFLKLVPKLELLDLSYNNLSSLTPNEIIHNTQIEALKLIGNPWRCDCKIAELWDWALLDKSNLGVLDGAIANAEHITAGKTKRKKLLVCNYDVNTQPTQIQNKNVPGRRPFTKPATTIRKLTATNRTWAKYVRESGCEQIPLNRSTRSIHLESFSGQFHEEYPTLNTWAPSLIKVGVLYLTIMIILILIYLKFEKKNTPQPIIDDKQS